MQIKSLLKKGSVTLFLLINTQVESQLITQLGDYFYGPNSENLFGRAIGTNANGTRIVVGAPSSNGNGMNTVKIYEYSSGNWNQLGNSIIVETGTNGVSTSSFGTSVKMNTSGSRIIVGDPNSYRSGDLYYRPGSFSVYELQGAEWVQLGSHISGQTHKDGFGFSVDINGEGNIIAVSAIQNNTTYRGYVKIFQYDGSDWIQLGTNYPIGISNNHNFGTSLAINELGTRIIVGAPRFSNWRGHTRVFDYNDVSNVWEEFSVPITYENSASNNNEYFGHSVSINDDGTKIAIGGYEAHNDSPGTNTGVVQVYEQNNSSWVKVGDNLYGDDPGDGFGFSVSLNENGNTLVVGAIDSGNYDGVTGEGFTRIFNYISNEGWVQYGNDISGTEIGDQLGYAIDLSSDGRRVIIGAPFNNETPTNTGQVSVYAFNQPIFTGAIDDDWNNPENWSGNTLPTETENVLISNLNQVTATGNVTVNSLTIDSGSSFTIDGSLISTETITIHSGASLIAKNSVSGSITYKRSLTNNWHLLSAPVSGQTIENLIGDNAFATGTGANIGLAFYNNEANTWNYQNNEATGSIIAGQGMAVKLNDIGDVNFSGTMNTSDVAIEIIDGSANEFNLIGNPYPSYLAVNDLANASYNLFKANGNNNGNNDGNTVLSEDTIWLWDQSINSYTQINLTTSKFIAPGQGFFVKRTTDVGTLNFNFTEDMQSHQSTDSFERNIVTSTRPEIQLNITNGTQQKVSDIFYISDTTTGWDNGYDSTQFSGGDNSFSIYTHLVSDSQGQDLAIQSLPDSDFENMTIPVGINATSGTEITISASAVNMPSGINVYLEDKDNNSFTLLNSSSDFTTTLSTDLNGIGRFYIHTTSTALSNDDHNVNNISIYTSDKTTLRIVGMQNGTAELTIYNILGNQILNTSFIGNRLNDINLPNIKTGVYIIQLQTEFGKMNKKIMIK